MQHGVLGAAYVHVHATGLAAAHPVAFGFLAYEPLVIMRIAETQVIPARAGPLRHGVGFAYRFIGVTNPFPGFRQRRFTCAGRLVILQRRRDYGQLALLQRAMFSVFPNDGERLAPVTLTRKEPVAQLVIDRAFAEAALLEPGNHLRARFSAGQAIDDGRIDGDAIADKPD